MSRMKRTPENFPKMKHRAWIRNPYNRETLRVRKIVKDVTKIPVAMDALYKAVELAATHMAEFLDDMRAEYERFYPPAKKDVDVAR